jgi:hypothetical protein
LSGEQARGHAGCAPSVAAAGRGVGTRQPDLLGEGLRLHCASLHKLQRPPRGQRQRGRSQLRTCTELARRPRTPRHCPLGGSHLHGRDLAGELNFCDLATCRLGSPALLRCARCFGWSCPFPSEACVVTMVLCERKQHAACEREQRAAKSTLLAQAARKKSTLQERTHARTEHAHARARPGSILASLQPLSKDLAVRFAHHATVACSQTVTVCTRHHRRECPRGGVVRAPLEVAVNTANGRSAENMPK